MHSFKTDVSILGTATLQQTLNVQGSAIFASTLQGQDVDFQNATFNTIDAVGEITSPALTISGDINVSGDLIGSETSSATLHSLSTENVNATTLNTTDIVSTGTISADTIVNSNQISTNDLVSTGSVKTEVVHTTDIVSSGIITSDTLINSNAINTKDITSTGVTTAETINTATLTTSGLATVNELTSTTTISAPEVNTSSLTSTNSTIMGTLTSKDIVSSGEITSETINNAGSLSSPVINSTSSINANAISSSTISNTAGIHTVDITSTGNASTNNITNTGMINTHDMESTGTVQANNLSSSGMITAKDINSTGAFVANVLTASEITTETISTSGMVNANEVMASNITSTGMLTTSDIVNTGSITTNAVTVQSMDAQSINVMGNIVTNEIQTNNIKADFLNVGNSKTSSFSNNVSWVLDDNTVVSPAWEVISMDGSEVKPLTTKIYDELTTFSPLGDIGTDAIPMNTVTTNVNARAVFKFEIIPAEDFIGKLQVLIKNESLGNILIQTYSDAILVSDEPYVTVFDSPLWLSATESVIVQIMKEDKSFIQVRANATGTAPYIKSTLRTFIEVPVFDTYNMDMLVSSIENLQGDDRLDIMTMKNIDKMAVGTYMGPINFSASVSQFNGAIKGSCWVAMTAGTLDGITFSVGDALISKVNLPVVSTINDPSLFVVKPNPNPVATDNTPGIVIAGNGLSVDGSGHLSAKLGSGVAFDNNFNIIADTANIDITQLKNYNTLQKGSFKGSFPSSLSDLAGSVRGDFWKASSAGTLGTQAYIIGDELYCTVDTTTAPSDLSNFAYVPQASSTMIGASSTETGVGGIVPSPQAGDNNKVLFGDATYKDVLKPTDVVNTLNSTNTLAPLSAAQGAALNDLIATKSSTADIVDNLDSMSTILPLSANQGHVLKALVDAKSSISDIVDTLSSTSISLPLSANQGYILNNKISLKLDKTDVIDNLTNSSSFKALSANQGLVLSGLINAKVNTTDIADNLTTNSASVPLSAAQGVALSVLIAAKANSGDIVDNLNSMNGSVPLSANQGRVLKAAIDTKASTADIVDSLVSTNPSVPLSANQGSVLNAALATKVNSSDVIDTLSSSSVNFPLSANQGRILNTAISTKVNITDVVDNLTSTNPLAPLSANQGRLLNSSVSSKVNVTDIVDSVNSTLANVPLSANQGKVLNSAIQLKVNTADIVDNLTSTSGIVPLSANQGRILNAAISTKINSADVIDTLTSNSVIFPLSANQGRILNVAIGTKVNTADVVDTLLSTSSTVPLSANQGRILNASINTKQSTLVSGTNIKTINGNSLLGSGDLITNNDATNILKGVIQLAGDLSGTASAPVVSKVNGISISGTPGLGSVLIATGTSAATWQSQTSLNTATTTSNGIMSAADKAKLDKYVGVTSVARVSCYNAVSKASLLAFGPMTANTAMTVTGNTSMYTGTTTGVTVTQAGLYKVTITAMITAGLINGGHQFGVGLGAGTSVTGAIYRIDALSVNTISNVSFCEVVSIAAGQNVGCSYMSSSILNTYQGYTMVIEKLD